MKNKWYKFYKILCYVLVAVLLYTLQNTHFILSINGTKPMLLIPFIIAIAMFESLTFTAAFSVFVGFLCDIMSFYTYGYYAMVLIIICGTINILSQTYVKPTPINAIIVTAIIIILIQTLAFFFAFGIKDISNSSIIYKKHILPMCYYTIITSLPLYYAVKYISIKIASERDI